MTLNATAVPQALAAGQIGILEAIARDAPLEEVLTEICRLTDRLLPGAKAGVTVLDRAGTTFQRCVMPSAPGFAAGIPGAPAEAPPVGTCAAAVQSGRAVESRDVSGDGRFSAPWRQLNSEHGVRCIKSWPALSGDGRAIGSFFIGSAEALPDEAREAIAVVATRLAGLAIEREAARERDRLLLGELQHRLRNLLASVQSIASQTARNQSDPAEFLAAFESRMRALAAAHDLLSEDRPADLAELVKRITGAFAAAEAFDVSGRPFEVAAPSIVPFSLVLHELATNATKHGALSRHGGRTQIRWKTYRTDNGEARFRFKWHEAGGPPVAQPPRRRGFGTQLVTRIFADVDGQSRLAHEAEGVRFRLDAPLSGRLGRPRGGMPGPAGDKASG